MNMIPLIISSRTSEKAKEYVNNYLTKAGIPKSSTLTFPDDGSSLSIQHIRDVKKIAARLPKNSAIIIYGLDDAKIESQNALLKTLEESGEMVIFIIIVRSYTSLLPTITSRCQYVRIPDQYDENQGQLNLSRFDSLYEAMNATASSKKDTLVLELDNIIVTYFVSMKSGLLKKNSKTTKGKIYQTLNTLLQIKKEVTTNNVSAEYAVDQALILVAPFLSWKI